MIFVECGIDHALINR